MAIFEMVKYHTQSYPDDIPLRTEECASHFDSTTVTAELGLSLHTEYSYGKRKFNSAAFKIRNAAEYSVALLLNFNTHLPER